MALTYTPMTELEAVNLMLDYAGYEQVADIDAPLEAEADRARNVLHRVSRRVQLHGYPFNTFYRVDFTPNGSGHIVLPTNVLSAVPTYENLFQSTIKYNTAETEWQLYDLFNDTFVWTVSSIKLNLTKFLSFVELPSQVSDFILWSAMVEYLVADNASQLQLQAAQGSLQTAYVEMQRYEIEGQPMNVLNNPVSAQLANRSRIDSYDIYI